MSNNFCKMGVLKKKIWKFVTLSFTCTCKNSTVKIWGCCMQLHAQEPHFLNFLYNWLWNFSSCQLKVFLHMFASDFPHIFCCLQIACSFPGNYSLENCRQICGKSKAGTACKDMQWQALKLTFFATWSISRKCMGMAPKCVIRILCWAALADNVYFCQNSRFTEIMRHYILIQIYTVISHAHTHSSRWLLKPWQSLFPRYGIAFWQLYSIFV